MALERLKMTKVELEVEIKRIFQLSKPTKEDLRFSRVLTEQYMSQTKYKINY